MGKFVDITGKKFNRLTAMKFIRRKDKNYLWLFKCDCGIEKIIQKGTVILGRSKSCGCLNKEMSAERIKKLSITHELSKTRFYKIYFGIKSRCNNINKIYNKNYGGRGIKCLWQSFEEFRNDMYESYKIHVDKFSENDTTINRINSNGNYCKENCEWATWKEQQRNRTNNNIINFNGEKKCITEWAEKFNISSSLIIFRIKAGWSIDEILSSKKRVNQFG